MGEPHCIYEQIRQGIHKFVIVKASHRAVDEFLEHASRIYAESESPRLLVDLRPDGLPAVTLCID